MRIERGFPKSILQVERSLRAERDGDVSGAFASNILFFLTAARTASAQNHESPAAGCFSRSRSRSLLRHVSSEPKKHLLVPRSRPIARAAVHTSAFSGQSATGLFSSYRARNHLTLRTRLANKRRARGIERRGIVERWEVKTKAQR